MNGFRWTKEFGLILPHLLNSYYPLLTPYYLLLTFNGTHIICTCLALFWLLTFYHLSLKKVNENDGKWKHNFVVSGSYMGDGGKLIIN